MVAMVQINWTMDVKGAGFPSKDALTATANLREQRGEAEVHIGGAATFVDRDDTEARAVTSQVFKSRVP